MKWLFKSKQLKLMEKKSMADLSVMKCYLDPISETVSRAITCINDLAAERDALKAKAEKDQKWIDELKASLDAAVLRQTPNNDVGGSTGGVVG